MSLNMFNWDLLKYVPSLFEKVPTPQIAPQTWVGSIKDFIFGAEPLPVVACHARDFICELSNKQYQLTEMARNATNHLYNLDGLEFIEDATGINRHYFVAGLVGFGATCYIANRTYQYFSQNELDQIKAILTNLFKGEAAVLFEPLSDAINQAINTYIDALNLKSPIENATDAQKAQRAKEAKKAVFEFLAAKTAPQILKDNKALFEPHIKTLKGKDQKESNIAKAKQEITKQLVRLLFQEPALKKEVEKKQATKKQKNK